MILEFRNLATEKLWHSNLAALRLVDTQTHDIINRNYNNNNNNKNTRPVSNTACLLALQNLKVFSVDTSANSFKRYDLLTDEGRLCIYYKNDNLNDLYLELTNEKLNRQSSYLDVKLNDLDFDELKFEINKLIIKLLK